MATQLFVQWAKNNNRASVQVSKQKELIFSSMLPAKTELRATLTGVYHSEAEWVKLDRNKLVKQIVSCVENAVELLPVVHVPKDQYGDSCVLWHSKPAISLVHEQFLVDKCVLELNQCTFIIDNDSTGARSLSQTQSDSLMDKMKQKAEIAQFLGNDAVWDMKTGKCNGAQRCCGKNDDGGDCGTFHQLVSKHECSNLSHSPRHFESVTCKARVVVLSRKGRFVIIPLDRCSTHPDLQVTKVPKPIRSAMYASMALGVQRPEKLIFASVRPSAFLLTELCSALINPDRVEEILRKNREKPDSTMTFALEQTKKLELEHSTKFLRQHNVQEGSQEPQAVILFTSMQVEMMRENPNLAADGTFCVFQELKPLPGQAKQRTWTLYNAANTIEGSVVTLFEIVLNGKSTDHYCNAFTLLFAALDEEDKARNARQRGAAAFVDDATKNAEKRTIDLLVEMGSLIFDFERGEAQGLKEALHKRYGAEIGQERFLHVLKLCVVHWHRIVSRRAKRFGGKSLFRALGRAVARASSPPEARIALSLMKVAGTLTRVELENAGVLELEELLSPSSTVTETINWSKNASWVDNLCSGENEFILLALALDESKRVGPNHTNHAEASHLKPEIKEFKTMVANSGRKSPAKVLEALFFDKLKRNKVWIAKRAGLVVSNRNSSGQAFRKNTQQIRQEAANVSKFANKNAPADPVKGLTGLKCVCSNACENNPRCGCGKRDQLCSRKCKCKCASKPRDVNMTTTQAEQMQEEKTRSALQAGEAAEVAAQAEAATKAAQVASLPAQTTSTLAWDEIDFDTGPCGDCARLHQELGQETLCVSCSFLVDPLGQESEIMTFFNERQAASANRKRYEDEKQRQKQEKRQRELDDLDKDHKRFDEPESCAVCSTGYLELDALQCLLIEEGNSGYFCGRGFCFDCADPIPTGRQKQGVNCYQCKECIAQELAHGRTKKKTVPFTN